MNEYQDYFPAPPRYFLGDTELATINRHNTMSNSVTDLQSKVLVQQTKIAELEEKIAILYEYIQRERLND